MAPIPRVQKKSQQQPQPVAVSTTQVYDAYGNPLDYTLRRQKHTDKKQTNNITINRQHAQQYESDTKSNTLVYRDVFPGRKYKLTLSDTTWMGDDNVCTIGYTVDDEFTQISSTATAPEDNIFDIEIPTVAAIDTLEIRLIGADDSVRGYLEDNTSSSSISAAIARLIDQVSDLISGQDNMQDQIDDLDRRVTALEEAQE